MTGNIQERRDMLRSARFQLAPETQTSRRDAIDRLVEIGLLAAPEDSRLTPTQIEETGLLELDDGRPVISRAELEESLQRLAESERVVCTDLTDQNVYGLSAERRDELQENLRESQNTFQEVIDRLFTRPDTDKQAYAPAFRETLDRLIGTLSEANILRLVGDAEDAPPLTPGTVHSVTSDVASQHSGVDQEVLERRTRQFFEEDDPQYNELKWRYGQNKFVVQSLGLDEAGYSISRELFGDATFFLDTNVLIHALEPLAEHHNGFDAVSDASDDFNISFRVASISIDEARGVAEHKTDLVREIHNQVPPAMEDRLGDLFYRVFKERVLHGDQTAEEAFEHLLNPEANLNRLGAESDDSDWYTEQRGTETTGKLTQQILNHSSKNPRQAEHDALLLRRISAAREHGNADTWLLTLDTTLPHFTREGADQPLAINLDAFLQWLGTAHAADEDEMQRLFSSELRQLLSPAGRFFQLRDFRLFAEMGMECREMPAEDVEECVEMIRSFARHHDLSDPGNREELMGKIARFFTSPDREYKQEVERLEARVEEKDERIEKLQAEHEKKLNGLTGRLDKMEDRITSLDEEREEADLRAEAHQRLLISSLLLFIVGILLWNLVVSQAGGSNLLQRVENSLAVLGTTFLVWATGTALWLGEKRMKTLGRPWNKLADYLPG